MKNVIALVFLFGMLFATSCKKETKAGYNGQAILKLYAKYNGLSIPGGFFYVKFDTDKEPDPGVLYDVIVENTNGVAIIDSLSIGSYYIKYEVFHATYGALKGSGTYYIDKENEHNVSIVCFP